MSTPTTQQTELKLRELLLLGNPLDVIVLEGAKRKAWTREDVLRVASANGWTLDPSGRVPLTERARANAGTPRGAAPRPAPAGPPALAVVPSPTPAASEPRLWTVLVTAQSSPVPAIKKKAGRILEQLTQLATDLEAAEQERAKRERVAKLERELAAAKAALKGGPSRSASTSVSEPARIRAWAKAKGIDVPAMGRVPKAVVERWRAETSGGAE